MITRDLAPTLPRRRPPSSEAATRNRGQAVSVSFADDVYTVKVTDLPILSMTDDADFAGGYQSMTTVSDTLKFNAPTASATIELATKIWQVSETEREMAIVWYLREGTITFADDATEVRDASECTGTQAAESGLFAELVLSPSGSATIDNVVNVGIITDNNRSNGSIVTYDGTNVTLSGIYVQKTGETSLSCEAEWLTSGEDEYATIYLVWKRYLGENKLETGDPILASGVTLDALEALQVAGIYRRPDGALSIGQVYYYESLNYTFQRGLTTEVYLPQEDVTLTFKEGLLSDVS